MAAELAAAGTEIAAAVGAVRVRTIRSTRARRAVEAIRAADAAKAASSPPGIAPPDTPTDEEAL
jgi:hypothetical protein